MSVVTAAALPPKRVLFVDDELSILEGIRKTLTPKYDVLVAPSGIVGLQYLEKDPTIAVVVSDLGMPEMDGAHFLSRARELAPQSVRMLLTGEQDMDHAIAGVNNGQVFRFLTKPCSRDGLRTAVEDALAQHRLQAAERQLLDQTVRGSIAALVDILALTNPGAFGQTTRIKTRVLELVRAMGVPETWHYEVAALASQLGYIVLSRDICFKIEHGQPLTDAERALVADAPRAAAQLLAHIPRLELVREILTAHVRPPAISSLASEDERTVAIGANILRFALDFDELSTRSPATAATLMEARGDRYPTEIMRAFRHVVAARTHVENCKPLYLHALRVGMTFAEDVRFTSGALLVTSGYVVTRSFIERVRNFPDGAIAQPVRIVTEN